MDSVYKYLGSDRSTFLEDGLLRFTQPAALNDPYECLAAIPGETATDQISDLFAGVLEAVDYKKSDGDVLRAKKLRDIAYALNNIQEMSKSNPWFVRDYASKINEETINKGLGILSLSRRWNSALMWSHYTNTYRGFCVGFRRDHSYFKEVSVEGLKRTSLMRVKYRSERTIVAPRQESHANLDVFITKSMDWAYEEEDRLLAMLNDADQKMDAKPHPIHLFKLPQDAISEIILGHNAPEHLRIDVLEAGKKLEIPVYKTQISHRSFDVERVVLDDGVFI